MSYHRGGQAGAVAVSYSTSPMAPHSPSRRCSSGSSATSSSAIGTSSSKLNTYRSTGTSSILDRPTNFYTSSGSSGYRSSYTSEYRRSYCPSGSFYSLTTTGTGIRRNYVSEYSRSRCSPARSVSSSAYSNTGTGVGTGTNVTANGTSGGTSNSRYGLSTSSSSSSISASSRDRAQQESSRHDHHPPSSAADIISRYSPSGYVPNIRQTSNTSGGSHNWKHHSTGSSLTELFGGDERDVAGSTRDRPESSLSSSSSSSSAAAGGALWPRSKRGPLSSSTVLTSGHVRAESAASPGEVTNDERGTVRDLDQDDNDLDDDETDDDDDDENDNTDDDQHNNNGNGNDTSSPEDACGLGVNNNDDDHDDDHDNLNNRHHHQQRAAHRNDEVSPAKHNILSPVPGGVGGAGAGFIGVKLQLLANLATNTNNTEPITVINNNDQDELAQQTVDVDIEDTGEVMRGIDDTIAFLQGGHADDPDLEDGDHQSSSASSGSSYVIDHNRFGGGATPPVLQNGVAGRPSGTYGDDPAVPSTSRRPDGHFSGNTNAVGTNSTPSTTPPSTTHQSLYRGVVEQFDGSPTNKSTRNRLQAHRDERCGLNGLRNIGNTCFMNSVIQCLSNTRPLLEYLLNEQYLADINTTTSSMKGALIKAFSQVIHELWEVGGDHVVNTTALKSQIQRFAPRFMGYSQQDAQEFLRYLLEGLHEDVNRVTVKPQPIHTDIPEMYTDSQKAVESWKRYLRSEDSMIVDVFVGQLRSSLRCTSCDHVSVTLDPFWDLSLPIPARSGTVKLSQCLEHFTREEVLDGDEKPTCSKCQMRRKCTKSFSIQKFPKILVIHLKRFSPMERFRGKLNVMVDFPLTGLDLSAFAAPRVPGCTYNLYGVANHSGTTYSGHYTAYCKHPYSGEWHEYNDSRVSVVPARSVVSSEAYVLFYEQQPHSSHL
ncbi:ubiquitin carboxyl-terminal hydrolase 2-like isoform X1 [Hylaeus anthracinus]|uniref:ubiquitin carboxyl-terminal hydrolase 2-like isoform X1 n=1 Tax=Hylaeus anthracinus TaxID=313031 RepID=UPI0023B8F1D7|nr:ubiquitin carboxyl-terminal hydrolase 2-like isoform X1 [Hylaeus anthracinus]XP_054007214.1 ubiquitin carboxyl-terminal hydrolase 2-like isoform X1 [Hylaeus anthracinus]